MVPTVIVVMGVSGSGKSTVGLALARRLGWDFVEGDEFHPPGNVDKMRRGVPLDDADREPWLDRLHDLIRARIVDRDPAVLTCSALKRRYRDHLADGFSPGTVSFGYLAADRDTLVERLHRRRDHHMPASLLDSQLAALEPPASDEPVVVVDSTRPVDQAVDDVVDGLGLGDPAVDGHVDQS